MANTFALVCCLFVLVSAVEIRADAEAPDSEAKAMQTRVSEFRGQELRSEAPPLSTDLEAKNLALQQRIDLLEKSLNNKQTEPKGESLQSLMIKELEEKSIKLETEKGTNKRLRGEIKKLKSKNANFKQMQRQNDNPKNLRADPSPLDCVPWIITFSRNVRGSNSAFNNSNLAAYKKGFNDKGGKSFWLGLDKLHQLTSTGKWDLLVGFKWGEINEDNTAICTTIGDKVDPLSGTWGNARWPNFKVEDASTNYTWHYGPMKESYNFRCDVLYKTYNGDHNGKPFSFTNRLTCGGFWYASVYNFAPTAAVPQFEDFCAVPGTEVTYTGLEAIMAIVKVE